LRRHYLLPQFANFDLVFPRKDDIGLQYEAVRHNKLVYQRPDFDRGFFYSNVVQKYLDFLPFLNVQRRAYKTRVLNGYDSPLLLLSPSIAQTFSLSLCLEPCAVRLLILPPPLSAAILHPIANYFSYAPASFDEL
jgi:hypothetical protein